MIMHATEPAPPVRYVDLVVRAAVYFVEWVQAVSILLTRQVTWPPPDIEG